MKSSIVSIAFACLVGLLCLTACEGRADYDIRGTWEYLLVASDGNSFDSGTITFTGSPTRGEYVELNFYQVEYRGEYRVKGISLALTGDEEWKGTLTDANTMSGEWQHADEYSGTFTATRQSP